MQRAIVVAGLGYGDEGKGSVVDYLVRRHDSRLVVRYNGGAQAAHNVMTDDGKCHTFSQFGAGTLVDNNCNTFLSRHMLVNPLTMLPEAMHLRELGVEKPFDRVIIDAQALVTTPFHVAMNRLRETHRGEGRHGSCGMGIGETVQAAAELGREALRIGDLKDTKAVYRKIGRTRDFMYEQAKALGRTAAYDFNCMREMRSVALDSLIDKYVDFAAHVMIEQDGDKYLAFCFLNAEIEGYGPIIFEGAQGVLIDQHYGFAPYNTWSDTTCENAMSLLKAATIEENEVTKLGVIRAHATRHGPGPFVTEDKEMLPPFAEVNKQDTWQGNFRMGVFDFVATRYAMDVCPVDELAVTHMDGVHQDRRPHPVCAAYRLGDQARSLFFAGDMKPNSDGGTHWTEMLTNATPCLSESSDFIEDVELHLGEMVTLVSDGPMPKHKLSLP